MKLLIIGIVLEKAEIKKMKMKRIIINMKNNEDIITQSKNNKLKKYINIESIKYFSNFLKIEEVFFVKKIRIRIRGQKKRFI